MKSLATVSKRLLQKYVFNETKIHGTALKQPIRIVYPITQKP